MESETERSSDFRGLICADNVQALASETLKTRPTCHTGHEPKLNNISLDESKQIPVIDMSKLDTLNELIKLHQACRDWSFFQLINHGMSEAIGKMEEVSKEFFKLSLEEKMVYEKQPNNIQGYGQAFVVSRDEKLDWNDMLLLIAQPLTQRDMRFWPTSPTNFRSTLDAYSFELLRVQINLLRAMAKNLGLDQDEFVALFENGIQVLRMNNYPPCQHADKDGISPHSDAMGLTLLVQINEVQGLQIKRHDKWIPINPLRGAIIVNIGDTIEILSNGEYKSIEHRVVVNPDKERLSIGGFHLTNANAMVGPISNLLKEGKAAKYKTMGFIDFAKLVVQNKLDGGILLDHLRIN